MDIEAEMERLSREARAKLDAEAPRSAGDDDAIDAELARMQGDAAKPHSLTDSEDDEGDEGSRSFPWKGLLLVVGAVVVLSVVWALLQKLVALLPTILVVGVVGWAIWAWLRKGRKKPEPE